MKWLAILSIGITVAVSAQGITWPDLPTRGFISGRPATEADLAAGNAAFVISGAKSSAVTIDIPQYAYWRDEEGKRHPMILIQAERDPTGGEILGLRGIDGAETVATLPEVELLGRAKPVR